jgi:TRAP-type mannitol/chloroaromatic compound transport system permease small subunit
LLSPAAVQRCLRLSQAIDRLTDILGKSLNWLVLITIAVGFYNVMARYIGRFVGLKLSSNALIELQWYLFSVMFFLGLPYILKQGANVRVDFLYAGWSDRRKAWVNFLGAVGFLIPFCLLGIFVTLNPVLQSWGLRPDGSWGVWEISPDADGLPRAPIKSMIIVSFGLLLLQSLSQTIKYWAVLMGYADFAQLFQAEAEQAPME